jgi:hypothetical protein
VSLNAPTSGHCEGLAQVFELADSQYPTGSYLAQLSRFATWQIVLALNCWCARI